jgi:hypothetical protein
LKVMRAIWTLFQERASGARGFTSAVRCGFANKPAAISSLF